MAASTPIYGFPYPTGTDRVMDGDNAMGALALAIENLLAASNLPHRMAAGFVSLAGQQAANSGQGVAITFPVGRFTQPPILHATGVSSFYTFGTAASGVTAAGGSVRLYNPTSTAASSIGISWLAVQMLPGAAPGRTIEPMGTETAYVVTCRTAGCGNEGEPITVLWDHEADGELLAVCGVCGQPITETMAAA